MRYLSVDDIVAGSDLKRARVRLIAKRDGWVSRTEQTGRPCRPRVLYRYADVLASLKTERDGRTGARVFQRQLIAAS